MKRTFTLIVALAACLLLPLGLVAAGPAGQTDGPEAAEFGAAAFALDGEPNDTLATATPWSEGPWYQSHYHYLTSPADLDFYRLEVSRADSLFAIAGFYDAGIRLALLDAGGALLHEAVACQPDAPGHYPPATFTRDVASGTYYVRVRACAAPPGPDLPYFLTLELTNPPDEQEPNDTPATANPLGFFEGLWADVRGESIAPAGDVDFFRFDGRAGQAIDGWVYGESDGFTPEWAVLDGTGAPLSPILPRGVYVLPATAPYYLRVRAADHPAGSGRYTLSVRLHANTEEIEPNNTPAEGTLTAYGVELWANFDPADPVDWYRFQGSAGDLIHIGDVAGENGGAGFVEKHLRLELYDRAMNPVALGQPFAAATLPTTGAYSLKVTPAAPLPEYLTYTFALKLVTGPDEPNDTMATATVAPPATLIVNRFDYPCDVDWFRFQGRAGDVFYPHFSEKQTSFIYAADGSPMFRNIVPADGTYYVKVEGVDWSSDYGYPAPYCDEGEYTVNLTDSLWVSADLDGLGGNAANRQGDIVVRDNAAGRWRLVFDASDVGIIRDVTAFERMPNGTILMSLDASQNVPGLGLVLPQDIIRFVPTSLGPVTAGKFQWFLDGSDVGLTTAGEKIDAIYMLTGEDFQLHISLFGFGSVPRRSGGSLAVSDEDIINLTDQQFGANSQGKWRLTFDGSKSGLGAEDVNALMLYRPWQRGPWDLFWVMRDGYLTSTPTDVLTGKFIVVDNLTDKRIDGLAIGPAR